MPRAKFISKEDCLRAMHCTKSNRAAARFMRCSFIHYKKYARTYVDEVTGKSLWEIHLNPSGKGIPKFLSNKGKRAPLKDLLEGKLRIESFDPSKIKHQLVYEGYLVEECYKCGYHEERLQDRRVPLILHFKNKDRKNYELTNLELLCYNCSFLYNVSAITDKMVLAQEDFVEKQQKEFDYEIDEHMMIHLRELGLWKEEKVGDGSQYISKTYLENSGKQNEKYGFDVENQSQMPFEYLED